MEMSQLLQNFVFFISKGKKFKMDLIFKLGAYSLDMLQSLTTIILKDFDDIFVKAAFDDTITNCPPSGGFFLAPTESRGALWTHFFPQFEIFSEFFEHIF